MSRQSTGLSREEKRSAASPLARSRFGRIPDAVEHSGLSRSYIYELARIHLGLFKKAGRSTLVDLPMLDKILADCPPATLRAPAERG